MGIVDKHRASKRNDLYCSTYIRSPGILRHVVVSSLTDAQSCTRSNQLAHHGHHGRASIIAWFSCPLPYFAFRMIQTPGLIMYGQESRVRQVSRKG